MAQGRGAGRGVGELGGGAAGRGEGGGAPGRGVGRRRRRGAWPAGADRMRRVCFFFTSHGGMGPFRVKSFADCH